MTTSYGTDRHPYGLLEAFALSALEPWEEEAVAAHVDSCPMCSPMVDQYLLDATALAAFAPQVEPPDSLRAKILDSAAPSESSASSVSVSVTQRRPPRSWSRVSTLTRNRWVRQFTPVVALLSVALIAVLAGVNVQLNSNMNEMQSENIQLRQQLDNNMATTTALARSSATVNQMQGSLQQWQQSSYALAQPGNRTIVMTPARTDVDSKGVLVMSEDGNEAVLMVSGLDVPMPGSVYHLWLTRGRERYWAGELEVDERGWGAKQLSPATPLNDYDSVQLSQGLGVAAALAAPAGSAERARATASMAGDMVMVASLQ